MLNISVLEFASKFEGKEKLSFDRSYFSDVVRGAIVTSLPWLKVLTTESVMALMQASGKAAADCEGVCDVDTGRLVGADYVIGGVLLQVGVEYKLTLKLYDTASGQFSSRSTFSVNP